MNKLKYIIPLFGSVAATAITIPLMVSCNNKKAEIECDAQKTLDVHVGDDILVKCHFTGKLSPIEYEGAKASLFDVAVYEEDSQSESNLISTRRINSNITNDTTKNYAYDFIDDNGDFAFYLHINKEAGEKMAVDFKLKILILDGNGIFRQIIDGFTWNIIPLGGK